MTASTLEHTTFVIQRDLPADPARAFQFWADPQLKDRWTGCHPDWRVLESRFDFREGGAEAKRWQTPDGKELTFHAYYLDVEAGSRIIYAYEMSFGGERLSASLVTIELAASGSGTRMKFTEQAVFSGGEGAARERAMGTEQGLDRLITVMAGESANAR